jgi:hypothetical protein
MHYGWDMQITIGRCIDHEAGTIPDPDDEERDA